MGQGRKNGSAEVGGRRAHLAQRQLGVKQGQLHDQRSTPVLQVQPAGQGIGVQSALLPLLSPQPPAKPYPLLPPMPWPAAHPPFQTPPPLLPLGCAAPAGWRSSSHGTWRPGRPPSRTGTSCWRGSDWRWPRYRYCPFCLTSQPLGLLAPACLPAVAGWARTPGVGHLRCRGQRAPFASRPLLVLACRQPPVGHCSGLCLPTYANIPPTILFPPTRLSYTCLLPALLLPCSLLVHWHHFCFFR